MSAATGELVAGDDVYEAPALLKILWADPQHMAEHLAFWSLARFGPRAKRAVAGLGEHERDELEQLVVRHQTRVAATEGAFVGGPFIVLIPVAFCAALLAQAQMVFELAAVAGHDPNDQMRAADLLVVLGVYPGTAEASAALRTLPASPKEREGGRLPAGTRVDMVRRMAYLLGVLGSTDPRSRLRNILGWVGICLLFLIGLVLPMVWVPYMAYAMRRSTLRLGARARDYYTVDHTNDAAVAVRAGPILRVGSTVAFARATLLVALPIVAGVLALLTGFSAGGHLLGALLVLIAVSALTTLAWYGYRWWRHRQRQVRRAPPVAPSPR